jgi:large subunit ribosomal protein L35
MPKQKTHKALQKRVKVTGRGRVRRQKANAGHLMSVKNQKRLRRLRQSAGLSTADERRTLKALLLSPIRGK